MSGQASSVALNLPELRRFARDVAIEAGELTLRYFLTDLPVDTKKDDSPVTRADREAEALIRGRIGERYPDHLVLGEEAGLSRAAGGAPPTGASVDDAPCTWIIDPIDGTRSFIAGVPLYAVLVAVVSRAWDGSGELETGRSVVGVLHFPALGETVHAARGGGATRELRRSDGTTESRPARVSTGALCGCRFGTTDFVDLARRHPSLFDTVVGNAAFSRTWGDAYGYLLVATGRLDAMADPVVSPWDIATLPVVLEEAGGTYTDLAGRAVLGASALASNGRFHAALTEPRD